MKFVLPTVTFAAAIAAASTIFAASAPAEAIEWRLAVERHYKAADEAKLVPRGDNPQWDFNLNTVVNDMQWRQRTAEMLRDLPKPGVAREDDGSNQLADRPEPSRPLRFSF